MYSDVFLILYHFCMRHNLSSIFLWYRILRWASLEDSISTSWISESNTWRCWLVWYNIFLYIFIMRILFNRNIIFVVFILCFFYSVGTSGDTGSAAINAVKSKRWIDIVVLYPKVAKYLLCPILVSVISHSYLVSMFYMIIYILISLGSLHKNTRTTNDNCSRRQCA